MVDDEGSTFEDTLARTDPRGRKRLTAEFGRVRYQVFARAADSEWWIYIAAIHRRPDAVAVVAGLIASGLAVEAEVCVIAQGPGPRAGRVIPVRIAELGVRSGEGGLSAGVPSSECRTTGAASLSNSG
jgi:hypothetical protein